MPRLDARPVGLLLALAACGTAAPPAPPADTTPPVTTATPGSQLFLGAGSVLLTTDEPATITWTLDDTDPLTSPSAQHGPSPQALTVTSPGRLRLRFFSTDLAGNDEQPRLETYTAVPPLRPASLAGRVVFHELMRQGTAAIALFSRDPEVEGWEEPVGFTTLAAGVDGTAAYQFEGLAAGDYWLAAVWWPDAARGDPEFAAYARQNPITLDPADPARARLDFVDLFLGSCDPEGTGIDGEIEVGEFFRDRRFFVGAFSSRLRTETPPDVVRASLAPGATRRPFALCDLPPGDTWIYAATREGPTIVASAPYNPVRIAARTSLRIQIGVPRPTLGSVRGTVSLSRPDPGGRATVFLTDEPPREDAPMVGMQEVALGPALAFDYGFEGLGSGEYWVVVALVTAGGATTFSVTPRGMVVVPSAQKDFLANFDVSVP